MHEIQEYTQNDIKKYICPTADDKEFFEFCQIVKARNLNPFLKEVHFVKYGNNPGEVVVGKDAILKRAKQKAGYKGFKAGWFNDEGEKKDIPVGKILGAWCEVYADDMEPVFVSVLSSEYTPKNITYKNPWSSKPATMIRKVAIAQAHREFAPEETGGLYEEVEILDVQPQEAPKKDVKQLLKPTGEWMIKLQNIKKDPEYKETIKTLAKDKKFKTGKDEESAEYNFNLIISFDKVEKVFPGSEAEKPEVKELKEEEYY